MNFRKVSKGEGGGIIFNLKNYIANFRNFKQGFLSMKLIQKGCFRQKYHNFSFKKVSMILDIENSILETFPYCENVQDLGFREYRRSVFSGLTMTTSSTQGNKATGFVEREWPRWSNIHRHLQVLSGVGTLVGSSAISSVRASGKRNMTIRTK